MSNNGGSEKKSPQKQKLDNNYDYNIWSQNHPPPRESNGNCSLLIIFLVKNFYSQPTNPQTWKKCKV